MIPDALMLPVLGFVVLWLAIGVVAWLHIRAQPDAAGKKKWFDRYAWLMGAFIAGTGGTIMASRGAWAGAALLAAIIMAMVWLRVRGSFFCGACGKFSATRNPFITQFRCPHCDNRLK